MPILDLEMNPITGKLDLITSKVYDDEVIARPTFVSHYNTSDGTNNASVNDIGSNRYIANPGTYDIGDWSAGSLHKAVHGDTSHINSNICSFDDKATTVTVNVYGADGVTILETYTTAEITGNATLSSGNITVTISGFTSDTTKYKGYIRTVLDIGTLLGGSGRFIVETIHNSGGNTYSYSQELFYDSEQYTSSMSGITIAEKTPNIIKLSGVSYFGLGSEFELDISDIDYLNSDSYPLTQVNIVGTDLGLPTLNLKGSNLTGWTNDFDDLDDTYNKTDWAITSLLCKVGSAGVKGRTIDWTNLAYIDSNSLNVAINSLTDDSTRIYEHFKGEDNRLQSDYSTAFDSSAELGAGDLQVGCSKLFYPSLDYTGMLPTSAQPDYSGNTGVRYYHRVMNTTGDTKSNGIFSISGLTETNISNDDMIIHLSYNGTDFYNLNEDYLGGELSDGQGCRIEPDVYSMDINGQIRFTFGEGGFNDKVYIKIEMPQGSGVQLDKLELIDW